MLDSVFAVSTDEMKLSAGMRFTSSSRWLCLSLITLFPTLDIQDTHTIPHSAGR